MTPNCGTRVQQRCHHSAPSPFSTQSMCVPTITAHIFFLRKKIPFSHRARGGTPTVSLALGAYREGKERVKVKASRIQIVCVCRNVQHRELQLPKSTRYVLITAVMVVVPTGGAHRLPRKSSSPLFPKRTVTRKKHTQAIGHRVYYQP